MRPLNLHSKCVVASVPGAILLPLPSTTSAYFTGPCGNPRNSNAAVSAYASSLSGPRFFSSFLNPIARASSAREIIPSASAVASASRRRTRFISSSLTSAFPRAVVALAATRARRFSTRARTMRARGVAWAVREARDIARGGMRAVARRGGAGRETSGEVASERLQYISRVYV